MRHSRPSSRIHVVVKQPNNSSPSEKSKNWFERNPSLLGFSGSIIGALITLAALLFTVVYSQRSLNLATEQFEHYRAQRLLDSIKSEERDHDQREKDSVQSVLNQKRDDRELKSLEAQINSLKETHRQFDASNEPYIQVKDPTIVEFNPGVPISVNMHFVNLGNYPVHVLSSATFISTSISPPKINDLKWSSHRFDNFNAYIVKESPISFSNRDPRPLDESRYRAVVEGKYFIYYSGMLIYQNLITKKIKRYKFILKLTPEQFVEYVYNENTTN